MSIETTETKLKHISVKIDGVEQMGYLSPKPMAFSINKVIEKKNGVDDVVGFFACNSREHASRLLRLMADSLDTNSGAEFGDDWVSIPTEWIGDAIEKD